MSIGSTRLIALGAAPLLAVGIAAWLLAKRHDRRLATAGALAAAVMRTEVANATGLGTARGIRIPFYEGESQQPTSIMLGKTATPVEGGKYLVTDMRVENFSFGPTGRKMEFVIEAPQCLVDPARKVASSAGRIVVSRTDGSFLTTGIGFEFRQVDSTLNISNQVSTQLIRERLEALTP
jgi:hypothetical protein